MSCGECGRDIRGGHAPECSLRCQALAGGSNRAAARDWSGFEGEQCERAAGHPVLDRHQLFDSSGSEVVFEW